jgi:hypothetical protein
VFPWRDERDRPKARRFLFEDRIAGRRRHDRCDLGGIRARAEHQVQPVVRTEMMCGDEDRKSMGVQERARVFPRRGDSRSITRIAKPEGHRPECAGVGVDEEHFVSQAGARFAGT